MNAADRESRLWRSCWQPGLVRRAFQIAQAQVHLIEIVADKDSRYKSPAGSKPEITLKAGEQVLLRVTARKAKTWNRDGSIHGFTLLRASDRTKVPDWNLLLRPGPQEFQLDRPCRTG